MLEQPLTTDAASALGPGTRSTGPLTGLVVVDLTRALAGPHAGMMMADLGARVIKVEQPERGDDTRSWGPPYVTPDPASDSDDQVATYFLSCNRNKESIALDLKSAAGRDALEALLPRADVLMENFRPGVLDRLGFSTARMHELNHRLVILSISGFGHDGPEGGRAGYDQIAQGEAGVMSVTGSGPDDPQRVGLPIGDLLGGMYGAYGALAALLERERTGRGQVVRTSLLAALVGVHAFQGTRWTVAGEVPRAQGNHHPSIAPYGLFRCADGSVQIAVGNDQLWRTFCGEFGIDPDREGLTSNSGRVGHRDRVIELVEGAFAAAPAAELLERLERAGIPAGRVRDLQEVYSWDQTRSQGLVVEVDHATLGKVELPGPPLRFFDPGQDGEVETTPTRHRAPPLLDADGPAIRSWLQDSQP